MIKLRDVRETDREQLMVWRNLPEVSAYMYTDHQISAEEHNAWFDQAMKDPTRRYWIIVCDGEDVGLANAIDIDEKNSRCYWAFYISSPNVRGKGVGSFVEYSVLKYVFEELKLNKLCCEVLGFNEAVVNMHQRFGFKQEGILREHITKRDGKHDVVCLGMLRDEWDEVKLGIEDRLTEKGLL